VNILYIGGPLHISSGEERLLGYRKAHKKLGVPVKEEMIRITNITAGASRDAIIQAIRKKLSFTAIVAFSDVMAYEILYTLRGYALSRYFALPIVGCDNICEKLMIPLSFPSVGSNGDEASVAVDLLLRKIRGDKETKPSVTVLDVELKHSFYNYEYSQKVSEYPEIHFL
jgi:DNA-binding LacI/PurR family transcriptional regulator